VVIEVAAVFVEVDAVFVEVDAVFVEVDGVFVELLPVLVELPEVFIELPGVFLERQLKIIASNAPLEWAWCAWVYGGSVKHNTHINIAAKAIRLLKQSVDCTTTPSVGHR